MQINSINIQGFGKFNNTTIDFNDGLNVIFGKNEAGKSTTHSFIKAMLFGMKKSKSKSKLDDYTKYLPWESHISYEGTLYFTHQGKHYSIHRIFSDTEPILEIRNTDAKRKVPNPELFLNKVLLNLTSSSFDNTISIGQMKTVQDRSVSEELRRFIANLNTSGSMAINTISAINLLKHKKESLSLGLKDKASILYNKQLGNIRIMEKELSSKEYTNNLPKIMSKKTSELGKINNNNEEIEKLKESIATDSLTLENHGFDSRDDIDILKKETEKIYLEYSPIANHNKTLIAIIINIALTILGIIIFTFNTLLLVVTYPDIASVLNLSTVSYSLDALTNFVINLPFHPSLLIGFLYCISLILIVGSLLLLVFNYQNIKKADSIRDILADIFEQQIKTRAVNGTSMNNFRRHMASMKRTLTDIENAEARILVLTKENNKLLTKQGEYEDKIKSEQKLQYDVEQKYSELYELKNETEKTKKDVDANEELTKEIDSIDLAIDTLYNLSDKIQVMFGTHLNKSASAYIEGLTDGKYKSLSVDDSMNITINYDGKVIPLEFVSTGTIDQIYLAIRLATMEVIRRDKEALPMLFDDCFAMYDNDRLVSSLKYLNKTFDNQKLIFTCHTREAALLAHNGIKYNKIEI